MKITIVCVGKVKEKYLRDAIAEYEKRLSRYCKLQVIEVVDEKTPDGASTLWSKTRYSQERSRTHFEKSPVGRSGSDTGNRRQADGFGCLCTENRADGCRRSKPYSVCDWRILRTS